MFNLENRITHTHLDEFIVEIEKRFEEVDLVRLQFNVFYNTTTVKIKKQGMININSNYMRFKQIHFYRQTRLTVSFWKKFPIFFFLCKFFHFQLPNLFFLCFALYVLWIHITQVFENRTK